MNETLKKFIIFFVIFIFIIAIIISIYLVYRFYFNRKINETCSFNSQCQNDACGRQTAADNAPLICCPSGSIDTFGGFDYCTQMPDGSVCWSDAMCAGGTCKGNAGGLQKGICTGNLPVNSSCTENADCSNNACGRKTAAEGAPLICCPSNNIDIFGGFDYCTQMPNGSVCWSDAMCAGGTCKGNAGGLQKGICTGNLPVNSSCTENADCSNNACGRKTAAEGAPLICCPSNNIDIFGGFDYCTQMPNGSTCWSDAMCESGYCEGNAGGFQRGTCAPTKLPVGSKCSSNFQCQNDACGRQTAEKGAPLICCPSNNIDTYFSFDYCTQMPNGSTCWTDAMCASNNCKGNLDGLQRGTCS